MSYRIQGMTPNHFISSGNRCPKCQHTESKGERVVRLFLDRHGISYKSQFIIPECKHKKPLAFDFMLECEDEDYPYILIEFDGVQHYKQIHAFGSTQEIRDKTFEIAKKRDQIKDNFCRENGIPLIRIPYTELGNVNKILTKKLGVRLWKAIMKYITSGTKDWRQRR